MVDAKTVIAQLTGIAKIQNSKQGYINSFNTALAPYIKEKGSNGNLLDTDPLYSCDLYLRHCSQHPSTFDLATFLQYVINAQENLPKIPAINIVNLPEQFSGITINDLSATGVYQPVHTSNIKGRLSCYFLPLNEENYPTNMDGWVQITHNGSERIISFGAGTHVALRLQESSEQYSIVPGAKEVTTGNKQITFQPSKKEVPHKQMTPQNTDDPCFIRNTDRNTLKIIFSKQDTEWKNKVNQFIERFNKNETDIETGISATALAQSLELPSSTPEGVTFYQLRAGLIAYARIMFPDIGTVKMGEFPVDPTKLHDKISTIDPTRLEHRQLTTLKSLLSERAAFHQDAEVKGAGCGGCGANTECGAVSFNF